MNQRFFRAKGRCRGSHAPGVMNKLESAYCEVLKTDGNAGKLSAWFFEAMTFKLAKDTRYTPDFMVMMPDGTIEFHECKGFMQEDAWLKLKIAAAKFPMFTFKLVTRASKKDGGAWTVKEVDVA